MQRLKYHGAVYCAVTNSVLQDAVVAYQWIDDRLVTLLDNRDNSLDPPWSEFLTTFDVDQYAEHLRTLDQYLTGKTEARRKDRDVKQVLGVLNMDAGNDPIVYLSDGGYSRLKLPEEAGQHLRLVGGGISTPRVTAKWNEMKAAL